MKKILDLCQIINKTYWIVGIKISTTQIKSVIFVLGCLRFLLLCMWPFVSYLIYHVLYTGFKSPHYLIANILIKIPALFALSLLMHSLSRSKSIKQL